MYQVNLELIKERRKTKGYSLKKMSDLMGFNDKAKYYRRETGEYNFKPEELAGIKVQEKEKKKNKLKIIIKNYRKNKEFMIFCRNIYILKFLYL